MLAESGQNKQERGQFVFQAERVTRECPLVTAWLERSVEEKTQAVCANGLRDAEMYRAAGALAALREILDTLRHPPPPDGVASVAAEGKGPYSV